jgi:alpha-galactosidase
MKTNRMNLLKIGVGLCCAALVSASAVSAQDAAITTNVEPAIILTPKAPSTPRINGAKVFGVHPGHPFLYTVAATGDRPITFSADGLPGGLSLDANTGHITGSIAKEGTYQVTLHAKNSLGSTNRAFKIVCGSTIGLTPALGWNSWNIWGPSVTAERVKAAADAMVATGLINHGWTYINIDDYWEKNPTRSANDPTLGGVGRDESGKIVPNPRFPDMKGLVDYIHSVGLKAGIYSGPGPTTCGRCLASWEHEEQDAKSYADWGFDYLKYDWCSYDSVITNPNPPVAVAADTNTAASTNTAARGRGRGRGTPWYMTNLPALKKPYVVMHDAIMKQPRDIMFSLCQYGWGDVWKWGADADIQGNSWRTTGDITDTWDSLSRIGFAQFGHEKFAAPGHFNDPDMMIIGRVSVASGRGVHQTHLSPNEQYTHVSLWCLLTGPLLIGCDMTAMDDFTFSLLSNDEVLDVSQDPLGHQAGRLMKEGNLEVWGKDMEDGSKAVGLFNRNDADTVVTAKWSDLGITGKQTVRDLWRQSDVGQFDGDFHAMVPHHGVVLVKITPAK